MQGTGTTTPSTVAVHTVLVVGDGIGTGRLIVGNGRPDGIGLLDAAGPLGFAPAELGGAELAGAALLGAG
jgi:hypothetical protein